MVYFFLALGGVWTLLGVMQLLDSWGQVGGLKSALASLLMAALNVAVAWFLHWRSQRRTGWRR